MKAFIVLIGLVTFACESGAEDKVFENQHQLFVEAIKSGTAAGALNGEIADKFNSQFKTSGPVEAQVKVVGDTKRADCKKMAATFVKRGISTPKGPTDGTMTLNFLYCIDGSPPVGAQ